MSPMRLQVYSSFVIKSLTVGIWACVFIATGCSTEPSRTDDQTDTYSVDGFESGCIPGYRDCEGNDVVVCAADGLSTNVVRTCAPGLVCTQGICAVCNPNQPFCQGDTVATCDDEGQVKVLTSCPDECAGGL